MWIDARIPVYLLTAIPQAGQSDRVLLLSAGAWPSSPPPTGWATVLHLSDPVPLTQTGEAHPPGCSCCRPRDPIAASLTRLFQARARSEVGFFRRVDALLAGPDVARLRLSLVSDPFVSSCYVEAA